MLHFFIPGWDLRRFVGLGSESDQNHWRRPDEGDAFLWIHHRDWICVHGAPGVQVWPSDLHHPLQGRLGRVCGLDQVLQERS